MSEWISVKERLPMPQQMIIYCANNNELLSSTGRYQGGNIPMPSMPQWIPSWDFVTHWMPLPEVANR